MRKLKVLWRSARSSRVLEEIETWASLLLVLGAVLLLYATLKAQAAEAVELLPKLGAPTLLESTMAAGARSTPWHEAYVPAVLAPGMPPGGGAP
jgi:hypothetical protein